MKETNQMTNKANTENFGATVAKIKAELCKDIVGQSDIINDVTVAIIAGGNVLLEGVPGVGKTRLVRSLSKVLGLPFSRIQFTPDLMPSDVTGTDVITKDEQGNMRMEFRKGPIFANLILADEINRATPKTQSAMLEVMQEHKVTVGGETYKMSEPFFVLATENPIEQEGTYPLPEAQMDRFFFKLVMKFPTKDELCDIVNMTQKTMDETAENVVSAEDILSMRKTAAEVPISEEVLDYAVRLVTATHPDVDGASEAARKYVKNGASPRAAQALVTCAKVRALIEGRFNVAYDDIKYLAYPVLRHRIKINYTAISEGLCADAVIDELLKEIKK
jgi:MoxR-like ATPase